MGFQISEYSQIIWVIVGCAVLLGLLALCRSFRNWRKAFAGQEARVKDCLATAARESIFEIAMKNEAEDEVRRISAVFKGIEKERLLLLTSTQNIDPLLGSTVEVSFVLTQGDCVGLYTFQGSVLGFFPEGEGYSVELSLPRNLNRVQRRAFLRCSPPASVIYDCSVWVLSAQAINGRKPLVSKEPQFTRHDLTLSNISAGGVKLLFQADACHRQGGYLISDDGDKCSYMIIYIHLMGTSSCPELRLWLMGKVIRVEPSVHGLGVSLKFLRWRVSFGGGELIPWNEVGSGGVEPLQDWVLRTDLATRGNFSDMPVCSELDSAERLAVFLRDPLTGVANESFFLAHMEGLLDQRKEQGRPLACIGFEVLDIEGVKATCGQEGVEHVLKTVALSICKSVRSNDMVGRFGENRFYLVLPETDLAGARILAGRLSRKISETILPLDVGGTLKIATRTGCAALSRGDEEFLGTRAFLNEVDASIAKADRA